MLQNIVDILCVNFKPNRKGTPLRINTYLWWCYRLLVMKAEGPGRRAALVQTHLMSPSWPKAEHDQSKEARPCPCPWWARPGPIQGRRLESLRILKLYLLCSWWVGCKNRNSGANKQLILSHVLGNFTVKLHNCS